MGENGTAEFRIRLLNNAMFRKNIPVVVYMISVMLAGFLGNILVLLVYAGKRRKTTSQYFFLYLAAADLVCCVFCIPGELLDLIFPMSFPDPTLCKTLRFLETGSFVVSAILLTEVAYEKYHRICKLQYHFSPNTCKRLCGLAVLLGVVLSWPTILVYGKSTVELNDNSTLQGENCSVTDGVRSEMYYKLYYVFVVVFFLMCSSTIFFVYIRIGIKVWKERLSQKRNILEMPASSARSESGVFSLTKVADVSPQMVRVNVVSFSRWGSPYRARRATIILSAVSFAFILATFPASALQVVRAVIKDFEKGLSSEHSVFYEMTLRSFFLSCAANPLIYSFLNANFRTDAKHVIKKLITLKYF